MKRPTDFNFIHEKADIRALKKRVVCIQENCYQKIKKIVDRRVRARKFKDAENFAMQLPEGVTQLFLLNRIKQARKNNKTI